MNPFHVWSADRSEPELWNGNQLLAGGKHYGFLDVQVTPMGDGRYTIAVQPWHIFPINAGDANFTVTGFEPRTYNDRVVLRGEPNNLRPVTPAACLADITGIGGIGGPDRIVSGDDFIAFIAAFAGESHLADVTGIGAAGAPDGLITGDDFASPSLGRDVFHNATPRADRARSQQEHPREPQNARRRNRRTPLRIRLPGAGLPPGLRLEPQHRLGPRQQPRLGYRQPLA
jgi:hypothetical protein